MAIPYEQTYAYVYDKGGEVRIGLVDSPFEIEWNRVLNEYSTATVSAHYEDCGDILKNIEPGRHELVLFRGTDRVWEGPIVRTSEQRDTFEIHARDVLHYTYRTIMRAGYNDSRTARWIEDRATQIIFAELLRHENLTPSINVLPYVTTYNNNRTRERRKILPYQKLLYEELEDMHAEAGLYFTTVGRAIHLWEKVNPAIGRVQAAVSHNDFERGVIITSYGMELATFAAATDGEGHYGWVGQADPYYGLWEMLDTIRPEQDSADEDVPSPREQFIEQARLRLAGRNPVPVRIRVPANSTLDPRTVFTLRDLVAGVRFPVRADFPSRLIVEDQMFTKIQFSVSRGQERIQISSIRAPTTRNLDDLPVGDDLS